MTPRILIVDDQETNRMVLADALEDEGYDLSEARNGMEALEAVRKDPPDVILLDVMMPAMDGIECCRQLKADQRTSHVPVILVTALDAERHVISGLDAGATDYIGKPFAGPVVRARIRAALRSKLAHDELIEQARRIRELAQTLDAKNSELTALALHDGLTGLPNRVLFRDRLEQAIRRGQRDPDHLFALLFLDLDRFKFVNDSFGHDAGDRLLVQIAERLQKELRSADTVSKLGQGNLPSRLGGDEFVVLLDGLAEPEDAKHVAERLQEALAKPYDLAGHRIVATASIGIITSDGRYERADDMLRDADAAMYHAKQSGRAQHVVFDGHLREEQRLRLSKERELRDAVQGEALMVCYEPIFRLADGGLAGCETSVYWTRADGSRATLDTVMPLAEETGLTVEIGRLSLIQACREWRGWQQRCPDDPPLTLTHNLTARQLRDPALVDTVGAAIQETAMAAESLMLEIPERVVAAAGDDVHGVLRELKSLGVRLSIDGFGTGHSALTMLHRLPVDTVKLDRELATSLGRRVEYAAVVQAVVSLAHNLKTSVGVDGVEIQAQLVQLQAFDCDTVQGPYFCGRLTPDAFEALLRQGGSLAMRSSA